MEPLGDLPDAGTMPAPRCAGCGYALTGLSSESLCPECGVPVRESLRGRRLDASAPEFRRTIGLGLTIAMIASICMAFTHVFRMALSVRIGRGLTTSLAGQLGTGLVALVLVCGVWLVTTPDPGLSRAEFADRARWRARLTTILLGLATLIQLGINAVNPAGLATGLRPGIAAGLSVGLVELALMLALAGAWVAWCVLVAEHLSVLAWRIPDRNLMIWTQRAGWALPMVHFGGYLCCSIGPIAACLGFAVLAGALRFHTSGLFAGGRRAESGEA